MAATSIPQVTVSGRMHPLTPALARRAVRLVLTGERREAQVSVAFLPPGAMRELNRASLGRDRPTDVLAFDLRTPEGGLLGDIYVCRAVAAAQAKEHGVPLREELLRLVVHGTLHVLGYDHPEGPGRTRSPMWRRQEQYVKELA